MAFSDMSLSGSSVGFQGLQVFRVRNPKTQSRRPMRHGIGPVLDYKRQAETLARFNDPKRQARFLRREAKRLAGKPDADANEVFLFPWHDTDKGGGGMGYGLTEHPVLGVYASGPQAKALAILKEKLLAPKGPFELWREVKDDFYEALNSDDRQNTLVARSKLCLQLIEPLLRNPKDADIFVDSGRIHYRNKTKDA
jgi:hypothetical protein